MHINDDHAKGYHYGTVTNLASRVGGAERRLQEDARRRHEAAQKARFQHDGGTQSGGAGTAPPPKPSRDELFPFVDAWFRNVPKGLHKIPAAWARCWASSHS